MSCAITLLNQSSSALIAVGKIDAEATVEASLLFVATAYDATEEKHVIPSNGYMRDQWPVDLFTFELEQEYNDKLYGGDGDNGEFSAACRVCSFVRHLPDTDSLR